MFLKKIRYNSYETSKPQSINKKHTDNQRKMIKIKIFLNDFITK